MGGFKKLFFVLLILIVAIAVFSYFRPRVISDLILGNEMTISLSADNKNLDLINGDSGSINFDFSVIINSFCKVKCDSQILDLSKDVIIEKERFDIAPLKSKSYGIDLLADQTGRGKSFYRFEVTCNAEKSWICRGDSMTRSRSLLIVMNRNMSQFEEQENIILQRRATSILEDLHQINLTASEIMVVSQRFNFLEFKNVSRDISESAEAYISLSSAFEDLWRQQKYELLNDEVANMELSVNSLQNELNVVKNNFNSKIALYNQLATILEEIRSKLDDIYNGTENATNFVIRFNKILDNTTGDVSGRTVSANSLNDDIDEINLSDSFSDIAVTSKVLNKIVFNYSKYDKSLIVLDLGNSSSKCCLFGKCMDCCENCVSDKDKYPVILLHGHDFSRDASAEYSLDALDWLQQKLEGHGFLNAGSLLVSDISLGAGSLAGPWPVTVKSSYYFDIYSGMNSKGVIETKTDNIDTYAIRLKDIIEVTKKKTNKDKVNLVAHSMGGLVVRRYLQIFGSDSVDKVIFIAVPNHGIDGDILKYCYLFGEKKECSDLDSTSLLMNKINNEAPKIQIYNIFGRGCAMGEDTGDGIVKSSSAYLEGAENVVVNGSCGQSNFEYLHLSILNFDKHQEVYDLVANYLKSE